MSAAARVQVEVGVTDAGTLDLTQPVQLVSSIVTGPPGPPALDAHHASHEDGGGDEVALDAAQIVSGTVADERLPADLARVSDVADEATARAAADALLIPLAEKGVANGVATLDADGRVPAAQLGTIGALVDAARAGLSYVRTIPTPVYTGASTASFRALAVDPNVPGRIWASSNGFSQLVHTDDDGVTTPAVGRSDNPSVADGYNQSMVQLLFAQGFAWLVTTHATAGLRVYRSPIPNASGTGWSWTVIFSVDNLVNGPGGAPGAGGDFATGRTNVLAVDASGAYLGEYSSAPITGGPSLYYSANALTATPANVVWEKAVQWPSAKHVHAVRIINNKLWVSTGDLGYTTQGPPPSGENTQVGMWICAGTGGTVLTEGNWFMRSVYGSSPLGNYTQVINFFEVTLAGKQIVVCESDNPDGQAGPILFNDAVGSGTTPFVTLCTVPAPYLGTMRGLTLDQDTGNLYWIQTGENGSIGPYDSVFMSPPPYTTAILLEAAALGTFTTIGGAVVNNGFAYFGTSRVPLLSLPWQ